MPQHAHHPGREALLEMINLHPDLHSSRSWLLRSMYADEFQVSDRSYPKSGHVLTPDWGNGTALYRQQIDRHEYGEARQRAYR